ncbi:alpha/beta fold hydrolase [Aestuariibius sp. 2305UL40-4]|uniref:bifunctional alpha/beta hydrolase/OsmC family protein n=1 Tax=Aestuariibius violaceus TaxID=3234132 RepID=UPI00345E4A12
MPTEKLTFAGHSGDTLAARLDLPDGPPKATALFAHCFTCSKDIPAARRISARLAALGIAVLRFDFTGLGHSKGEFENTNFTSNVADLRLAAQALADRGLAPQLIIGHSLGGAAVLKAAPEIPSIKAVVTIGAPFDPEHVTNNFRDQLPEIIEKGIAEVKLAGRPFRISSDFLEDVSKGQLTPAISGLKAALLVLHSPVDQTVGIENASEIFLAAKHPKSFVTLDKADHLVSDHADADYAADVISAWATRYLDLSMTDDTSAPPDGVVRVSEVSADGFLQTVQSGPHSFLADEPPGVGGTDRGPTPYDLLSAALGACTAMTIRMYARHKGLPLDGVSVDIRHDKTHLKDAEEDCIKNGDARADRFTRQITVKGDLDEAQRQKLLEIADKCPVHRTLERSSAIETKLSD